MKPELSEIRVTDLGFLFKSVTLGKYLINTRIVAIGENGFLYEHEIPKGLSRDKFTYI